MDVDIEFRLKQAVSPSDFIVPLSVYGDVNLVSDTEMRFDWKSALGKDFSGLQFSGSNCYWSVMERYESAPMLISVLANILRLVSVCESCFAANLCTWWALGINRTSGQLQTDSKEWFSSCAAFHNDAVENPPGFISLDGVALSISALRRLTVIDEANAPTNDEIDTSLRLSTLARTYVNHQRSAKQTYRALIRERVEHVSSTSLWAAGVDQADQSDNNE